MMAGGDEEFANFSRLVKLIVNVGSDVLRDVLVHVIRPQTLEYTFQTNLTTINRLHKGKPKVLFDEEFTVLNKIPPNPKDFDITLLVKIFRNICTTICPTVISPNHDWNKPPGQTDISLADDIHRVRDIRNSMFAHIPNTNVTYNDFQAKWSEVREVILRISGHGSPGLKQQKIEECIDNLKTETIHQSTFQGLLKTLREQEKNHKETMEELKKMDATQREIRDTVGETRNTVGENRDSQVEMSKKVDTLVQDLKEKRSDLTRFKWVAKGMQFYDAEQEECGDEHGTLSYTGSPEVMKLAKDSPLDETVSTVPKRMAPADAADDGNVFKGDGLSEELTAPCCDLCFKKNNTKIEASVFCLECHTFMCKPCVNAHNMFAAMRNHRLLQGGRLPKTQADRPVKYLDCDIHKGSVNDNFCMDHSKMVCSQCIAEFHRTCKQNSISDLCTDLGPIDIQEFRDAAEKIKKKITSVKINKGPKEDNIRSQKNEMIKEAQELRDQLILKIETAYNSHQKIFAKPVFGKLTL